MTIAAGGLLVLIRARYPGPEWAVLDELHDGTGGSATRRFDAVAVNCWPSHGFVRLGFEIDAGYNQREAADVTGHNSGTVSHMLMDRRHGRRGGQFADPQFVTALRFAGDAMAKHARDGE